MIFYLYETLRAIQEHVSSRLESPRSARLHRGDFLSTIYFQPTLTARRSLCSIELTSFLSSLRRAISCSFSSLLIAARLIVCAAVLVAMKAGEGERRGGEEHRAEAEEGAAGPVDLLDLR